MRHGHCYLASPMKTVLLVDDETLLRETLAGGLRLAGYNVRTADGGLRAIETLGRGGVEMVVTDLCMPGVDGFSLLEHLGRHYPELPVIALTGYGFPDAGAFVTHLGARVFLEKPILIANLADAISQLLAAGDGESRVQGFTLPSFLQLMELDKKTCLVSVEAGGGRSGQLGFQHGLLVHATTAGGRAGDPAVGEMFGWCEPRLRVSAVVQPPRHNVRTPLATLLMESARTLDEASAAMSLAGV